MRIGSLFSGYGGLDMAVQAVLGGTVAWYSEIEPAACRVLEAHLPGVPNLGDVTTVDWSAVEPVDVLTGGYPCQPFSHAGKRKGTNDERHLWPYVRDALAALRPMVAVFENVDGHRSLGLADVLGDLAELGMSARWGVVRAADADRPSGEAWGDTGPDSERVWVQPVGLADPASDAGSGSFTRLAAAGDGLSVAAQCRHRPPAGSDRSGREEHCRPVAASQEHAAAEHGSDAAADSDRDGHGSELHARGMGSLEAAAEGQPCERERSRPEPVPGVSWGKYESAIRRWERVIDRLAPEPTIPGSNGRPRLSPVFVEWMMGLPEGHVTGHGLSNAQCLKMLGNGVVPQQAALALRLLGVAA
jgi:DNA (cytosine-5)-methyltransferase 1